MDNGWCTESAKVLKKSEYSDYTDYLHLQKDKTNMMKYDGRSQVQHFEYSMENVERAN